MIASIESDFLAPQFETAILELWNRNIGRSFPLDRRLYEQQLSLDKDQKVLFIERFGGQIRGAALVKRPRHYLPDGTLPAIANISFIIVDKDRRAQGLGSSLLESAELWARARGARKLLLGADRYHFFPGIPQDSGSSPMDPSESEGFVRAGAFFKSRGFEVSAPEADLIADISGFDYQSLATRYPLAPDYRFGFYSPECRPSLTAFFKRNFPGRWYDDTIEALDAGMRPQDLALIFDANSQVQGFARIYDAASPVIGPGVYWRSLLGGHCGGLGPIGVDEKKRGLGLGIAILRLSIQELAKRGVGPMVIDWTDLLDFYGKLGFSTWKSYLKAVKLL